MKSRINVEKTASSALLFTVFGLLAASLSPAVAATTVNKTTATSVKTSTQGFSASTFVGKVKNEAEARKIASLPSVGESSTSSAATDLLKVTDKGSDKSAALLSEASRMKNDEGRIQKQVNSSRSDSSTLEFENSNKLQSGEKSAQLGNFQSQVGILHPTKEVKSSTKSPNSSNAFTASILGAKTQVKQLNAPMSPNKTVAMSADETLDRINAENPNPESVEESPEADDSMSQVNNVSQLRDVRPGDWAYEALRELVERYGCIAGYPDGSFRGNRAMTRYEFAAGLRACLNQIEKLIAGNTTGFVSKTDLEALRRLTGEFQAELTALGTRVDKLEGRVGFLENHQFSTTTKLFGQAVIGVQGRNNHDYEFFLNQKETGNQLRDRSSVNVISNVQLSLLTQFSPRSVLLTGLQAGSGFFADRFNDLPTPALGYEGNTNNSVVLSDLTYRQLIGNNFAFIVGAEGVNPVNVFRGANRVESAGTGPLSRFAQRNPIINIGAGRTGLGFDWQIATPLSLQGVYSTSLANDPNVGGIFGSRNGETTAGLQLNIAPTDNLDIAINYLNSYSPFGRLATGVGDDILALPTDPSGRNPMKTNAVGATVEWRASRNITIGGWAGYTTSDLQRSSGSIQTINWMGFLNFPDLGGRGNLAGIYVGQPPKIISSDLPAGQNVPRTITRGDVFGGSGGQPGTTLHTEGFYRFRVADNISITPGVIVIFNPGHNKDNQTEYIGAIRTTFTF